MVEPDLELGERGEEGFFACPASFSSFSDFFFFFTQNKGGLGPQPPPLDLPLQG